MKTGIIYISKHGTTQKVAEIIAEKLNSENVEIINLRDNQIIDLNDYDRIIIGASIHAGSANRKTKLFCKKNTDILLTKKIGLYICSVEKGDKGVVQFNNAYMEEFRKHAKSIGLLGYEFNLGKMNFIEKFIVKVIAGSKKSISEIDYEAISNFVNEFEKN